MSRGSTSHRARTAIATAAGLACALAMVVTPASAATDDGSGGRDRAIQKIRGEVGPGFTLSFSETSVPAGKYKVIVNDKGTIHNFHMTGDGVNKKTKVSSTGKVTWRVTLTAGEYVAECDPHPSMRDILTVT
jgi:plastocyanin